MQAAALGATLGFDALALLRSNDPAEIMAMDEMIKEADKLMRHRFRVLAQEIANAVWKGF